MISKKRKIKEIAGLNLGHTFRVSPNITKEEASFSLVQVKDVDINGNLLLGQLETINHKFSRTVDLLQKGDIIFCPRDHKLIAALVTIDLENTLISAPLILIRVHCQKTINPEYLQLYLNSKLIEKRLKSLLLGSSILTLQKSDLAEIEVPIPSIKEQELLSKIYSYSKLERKLRDNLYGLKNKERNAIVNKSLESLLAA